MEAKVINEIERLAAPTFKEIHGMIHSSRSIQLVRPPQAKTLNVFSLQAVVDYCIANLSVGMGLHTIHIVSESSVYLYGPLDEEYRIREQLIEATSPYNPFAFDRFIEQEDFVISLLSMFCKDDNRDKLLDLVSSITDEGGITSTDDGTSQQVNVKKGVSLKDNAIIPNPVTLAPYRTFAEVDQPESAFVCRVKNGPYVALFEADGGVWRIEAVNSIRAYFQKHLQDLIDKQTVSIIG